MWNKILDNTGLISAVIAAAVSFGVLKTEVSGHGIHLDKVDAHQESLDNAVNKQAVILERIEYKVDWLRCEVTNKGCK